MKGFAQLFIPIIVSAAVTVTGLTLFLLGQEQYISDIQFGAPTSTSQRSIIPTLDDQFFVGSTSPSRRFQSIHIGTGSSTFAGSIGVGTTTGGSDGQWLQVQGFGSLGAGTSTLYSGLTVSSITATSGIAITGGCYLQVNGTCLSGGTPGGANTQVQFNDSGSFGGDAQLTYNKTTDVLTMVNGSSTSFSLSNLLNVAGEGTSTYAGGLSVSSIGGLSTVSGLTITGGRLLGTNIGATLGSTSVTGLTSSGGLFSTAGDFLLTGGKIISTGTGTSTFTGGASFAGLSVDPNGLIVVGSGRFQSGINVTGTGTSTISQLNSDSLAITTGGIVVTGGSIVGNNIGATFGSTTVGGLSSSNGVTLTGGCFKGPTGNCIGAAAAGATGLTLLTCNKPGGTKPCVNIAAAATSTIAVTGLPSRDFYRILFWTTGKSAGGTSRMTFNDAKGESDYQLNKATVKNEFNGTTELTISSVSDRGCLWDFDASLDIPLFFTGDLYATSSQNKQLNFKMNGIGGSAATANRMLDGSCTYYQATADVTMIEFLVSATSTDTFDAGTTIQVYGYEDSP